MEDHRAIGKFDEWFGKCESLAIVSSFILRPLSIIHADWAFPKCFGENGAYQRSQSSAIPADEDESCKG